MKTSVLETAIFPSGNFLHGLIGRFKQGSLTPVVRAVEGAPLPLLLATLRKTCLSSVVKQGQGF